MLDRDRPATCKDVLQAPIDPISAALMEIDLQNVLCCRSELTAPFGMTVPVEPGQLMFHIGLDDQCLLVANGEQTVMGPGHFALVTKPGVHTLCSAADVPAVDVYDLPTEVLGERIEVLRYGGGGRATSLVCGVATLRHPLSRLALDALPDIIHTDALAVGDDPLVCSALQALGAETTGVSVGGAERVRLLANLLVIEGLRAWLNAQDDSALPRWFGALRHPRIGRVLTALHADPGAHWTVDRMAADCHMSKSAFHDAFKRAVGVTPVRYLLRWRMHYAASSLATTTDSIAEVARSSGYDSESAFSRAFRREFGHSPGQERRLAGLRASNP
ncbi:MAG: AraC family transcriptional regulator [Myxococcota bacterium]